MKMRRITAFALMMFLSLSLFTSFTGKSMAASVPSTSQKRATLDKYYNAVNAYKKNNGIPYWNGGKSQADILNHIDDYTYGLTTTACHPVKSSHSRNVKSNGVPGCTSNGFGGGWQCIGFARYLSYIVNGSVPNSGGGWTTYTSWPEGGLLPGDYLEIYKYKGTGTSVTHAEIVYHTDDGKVHAIDCNNVSEGYPCRVFIDDHAGERWTVGFAMNYLNNGRTVNGESYGMRIYRRDGAVRSSVKTTEAKKITETNFELHGTASSSGAKITGVGMYIGKSENSMTLLGKDFGTPKYQVNMWYSTEKYGYTLERGQKYYYQAYAVINGEEVLGDIKSFTTKPSDVKITVSTDKAEIDEEEKTAVLYGHGEISGGLFTGCGMYIGTSPRDMTLLSSDESKGTAKTNFWYSTEKYGYPLEAGQLYYYKGYVEFNNEKHFGDIKTFSIPVKLTPTEVTEKPVETVDPQPEPETPPTGPEVHIYTDEAKNITSTSAVLYGHGDVSGGLFTGCGMYIGTSDRNMTLLGSDTSSGTAKTNFWYSTSKYGYTLKPGTKYYYKGYVLVNGEKRFGAVKSFTTPQAQPSNTRRAVVKGTVGNLNINSRPASGYAIGMIPEGATCTVYPAKTSGNWYWVEYNGMSGYAYKKYLQLQ